MLQAAAAGLIGSDEERRWRAGVRARYLEARALCAARLSVPAFMPEAGTYFLLDLRAVVARRGESSLWPLVEQLLTDGVSISPGEQFGSTFSGHARICYSAVPLDRLALGLERIARLVG